MVKVALIDDHKLFRKSLTLLIRSFEGLEVVYDSDDGLKFLEFANQNDTMLDLVLLDIQMPIINGFEICRLLKESKKDIKILIVSQLTSKEAIHHVMECGANGFVSKEASPLTLEEAIAKVMEDGFYFDVGLSEAIREIMLTDSKNRYNLNFHSDVYFSDREIQIIKLVCREKSCEDIARMMGITPRTVETHRTRLIRKLNAKNFIGVILYALKTNTIHIDDF